MEFSKLCKCNVILGQLSSNQRESKMFSNNRSLSQLDPHLHKAIIEEHNRQETHLELIASENYASPAVMSAQGSVLTNKYAEGYPGKRYYGGCEHVDVVETIAIERCKELYGSEFANVQPHSGAQANASAFLATLKPGDKILGMSLAHGGHLTHGSPVNFSGKTYQAFFYGLNKNEEIDYDQIETIATKERPKLIIAGASAYSRVINWKRISEIASSIGALFMVDMAHYSGLIATGAYPSPVPYADFITSTTHKTLRGPRGGIIIAGKKWEKTLNSALFPGTQGGPLMHVIAAKAVAFKEAMSEDFKKYQKSVIENAQGMSSVLATRGVKIISGGTDCHLLLLDLRNMGVTGKDAESSLGKAHLTVNKNSVPNDPESPFVTSGIRIGTAAITTRGMSLTESEQIANLVADVLHSPNDEKAILRVASEVQQMCKQFPVYPKLE